VDITNAVLGYISVGFFRTEDANTFAYDAWLARRADVPSGAGIQI
jgi:hypothetical protein